MKVAVSFAGTVVIRHVPERPDGRLAKAHLGFLTGLCLVGILLLGGCRSSSPGDGASSGDGVLPASPASPHAAAVASAERSDRPQLWGDGIVEVAANEPVTVGSHHTWRVSLTTKGERLDRGDSLLFIVTPFWGWSPPQTLEPLQPGYTTVETSNPAVEVTLTTPSRDLVRADIIAGPLNPGQRLTFVYGDTGGGLNETARARVDNFAERAPAFFIRVSLRGDDHFRLLCIGPEQETVAVSHGQAVRAYAPSDVVAGEPFRVRIAHVDGAENRSSAVFERLRLIDPRENISIPVPVDSFNSGAGSIAVTLTADGWHHLLLVNEEKTVRFEINPLYCHSTAPVERLFWGDIHGHSALSDGTGTPHDYFAYARDVSGLDFSALTDHDDHGFLPLRGPSWQRVKEAVASYHEPGRFITFLAWEWTSWTVGHRNVYFPGDAGEVYPFSESASDTLPKLWACLEGSGARTVPHHPAGGPIAADWRFHDPHKESLVEIVSVHGSSEASDSPSLIYKYRSGASVFDALNRGYRLGIIGSSDSHDGHPGAYPRLGEMRGLVAVRAPHLTREVLWTKLMAKNCYATSGARIYLDFSINGHPMGSELTCLATSPRNVVAHATGTGYIEDMVLIRNGEIIKRVGGVEYQSSMTLSDTRVEAGKNEVDWYVVRVLQLDGQMAWSSPIHVSTTEELPAGPTKSAD